MAQPTVGDDLVQASVGGVSHSPRELTRWQDCTNGANVLLATILEMDQG